MIPRWFAAAVIGGTLLAAGKALPVTRYVPTEYPTIQAALDAVQAGDTVLVALGTYSESLTAPNVPFVLKGDALPDTGDHPRPVVDPSSLPGSDSLLCMTVPASSVPVIDDFRFRNGPAMYPRRNGAIGGLKLDCGAVAFRQCVFDSLYDGLIATAAEVCSLRLDHCRFLDVTTATYGFPTRLFVDANDCLFTGHGWAHVTAAAGCRLQNCQFGVNWEGPAVQAMGKPVSISNCQFGPSTPTDSLTVYPVVDLIAPSGNIEDNLFTGMRSRSLFISVGCACNGIDRVQIKRNRFVHNRVDFEQGRLGVGVYCQNPRTDSCGAEIDSNLFDDNTNNRYGFRAIAFSGQTDGAIRGNSFRHLAMDSAYPFGPVPVVRFWGG